MSAFRAGVGFTALAAFVRACGGDTIAPPIGIDGRTGSGNDAGDASEASSSKAFCASHSHLFCDDFDEGAPLAQWSDSYTTASQLSADAGGAVSPPNALRALRRSGQDESWTHLRRNVPNTTSHAVIELDVQVQSGPSTLSKIALFDFVYLNGLNWHFRLYHDAKSLEVGELYYGAPDGGRARHSDVVPVLPFPFGKWVHVKAEVVVGPPAHGKISIDGTSIYDRDLLYAWKPGTAEINIGAFYPDGAEGDWDVLFDNVTLDLD